MFSWQNWEANLTDNSKIRDEFEQNKLSEVNIVKFIVRISSPILELSVKLVSQICQENTNKPLDGAYLADFGIDINGLQSGDCRVDKKEHTWNHLKKKERQK